MDPSASDAALTERVAWLARVTRGASEFADSEDDFARRMEIHSIFVDGETVEAWESGARPITAAVLQAYETVLGFPSGRLTGPCTAFSRLLVGHGLEPPRVLPAPEARRELDRLADLIRNGFPTGRDWMSLAHLITQPEGAMLPGFLEREWLYQLIDEMSRSTGEPYLTRTEALSRLMGHELQAQRLVALVRDRVHEAGAQAIVDVLAVWGAGRDLASVDAAIALLVEDDEAVRAGAGAALVGRMYAGSFPAWQQQRLKAALELLSTRAPASLSSEEITLGTHLAPELGIELAKSAGRSVSAPGSDEAPPIEAFLRTVSQQVDLDADPVLADLLREAFGSPAPAYRTRATLMIAASPMAPVVARVCLALHRDHTDAALSRGAGLMVGNLATHLTQEDLLELLALKEPRRSAHALVGLAHSYGVPDHIDLEPYILEPQISRQALYAAGMSQHPVLARLDQIAETPAAVRQTARWWIDHGGRVWDSEPA